jgi:hypothetical protein
MYYIVAPTWEVCDHVEAHNKSYLLVLLAQHYLYVAWSYSVFKLQTRSNPKNGFRQAPGLDESRSFSMNKATRPATQDHVSLFKLVLRMSNYLF